MNAPRQNETSRRDEAIRSAESDRRFARLLDATLGGDLSPRRRRSFDATQRVLASLGFREISAAERRVRRLRRQGQRLLQAAVLVAAATGGVMLHNLDSTTIHGDDALPRALDRTLDGILRTGFVRDLGQDHGASAGTPAADGEGTPAVGEQGERGGVDGILRRLDSGLRDRLRPSNEGGLPFGEGDGEGQREPTETATAPFRWI